MTTPMRAEVWGWDEVRAARHSWDALVDAQPFADPTRRLGWLEAWWAAFGATRRRPRAQFVVVQRDGRVVAGAALMVERLPGGMRLVRHLGTSPHWFDPEPLVAPGDGPARAALVAGLLRVPADLLALEDLSARGAIATEWRAHAGALLEQGEHRQRLVAATPPKLRRRRKETRRLMRRVEEAGRPVQIELTCERDTIVGRLPEICDLIDRVWRPVGDGSDVIDPPGRLYLSRAVRSLPADGALLVTVAVQGRLAAFDLVLRAGADAVMFRGSWDPASEAPGSGWASMLAGVDHLLAEQCRAIDLGKFAWEYKRSLASGEPDELVTAIRVRGWRGRLALAAWRARPQLLALRRRASVGVAQVAERAVTARRRLRPTAESRPERQ